jgi:phosphate-selective porin OprO/OprP
MKAIAGAYKEIMKSVIAGLVTGILALFVLGVQGECLGDSQALEQLLKVFEQKGLLSPDEAGTVRQSLAKEREATAKREKELEAKEADLLKREDELRKREQTLRQKEPTVSERDDLAGKAKGAAAEEEAKIIYQDGLCVNTATPDEFSLCLGGLLQGDYRHFNYGDADPNKDRFDIRRSRLIFKGRALKYFDYKFQYEFQGAGSRNLLDAYADVHALKAASFRIGQFKEPFGLEQSTDDRYRIFAEPSIGFNLTPNRDAGLMAHGSLWTDSIYYGIGIFNGDGLDDTAGGDEDSPQVTGRMVVAPFKSRSIPLLEYFQVGGSFSYANMDRNNVRINLTTTGLTTVFDVASAAKFRIIREADSASRYGAEMGWAFGPFALMAEYIRFDFKDVRTSAEQFDIELRDYYVAILWMITGEKPTFGRGVFQPITPERSVFQGGWGGLGAAFRYDSFEADEGVYDVLITAGESVRKVEAYSVALNWYLNAFARLIVDYTRSNFDVPLLILRDPLTGTAVFSDHESVLTGRFQFQF